MLQEASLHSVTKITNIVVQMHTSNDVRKKKNAAKKLLHQSENSKYIYLVSINIECFCEFCVLQK